MRKEEILSLLSTSYIKVGLSSRLLATRIFEIDQIDDAFLYKSHATKCRSCCAAAMMEQAARKDGKNGGNFTC